MREFRAVVFDLDGTLVDSEPIHMAVTQAMLAGYGHAFSAADFEAYIGGTTRTMWLDLIPRFGLRGSIDDYLEAYERALLARLREGAEPAPGAAALVRELHDLGVPLAVASSSLRPWILATLSAIGLRRYFRVVVGADEVVRGKPSPEVFATAARRLGVEPPRCLAFEDSAAGIASAKAAGMYVIAVCTPYTTPDARKDADEVVETLEDVDLGRLGFARAPACR